MGPDFPQALQGLLSPRAYPHNVQPIKIITTHISWVLLTGEFAYKIKRPVRYPFVDLRAAERRAFLCQEELRLNRRFSADLYLEVCPITLVEGGARMGGAGQAVEHAVKMRQFPADEQLHQLLEERRVEVDELRTFGRDLALIHAGLPVSSATQPWGQPATAGAIMIENLEECARAANQAWAAEVANDVLSLRDPLLARIEASAPDISQRFANGKVRECHGDLHTGNVVRTARGLVAFDCLEFDPVLRWIDVADEIAFLLADLEASHAQRHAHAFLGGYLDQSGDFQGCRLLKLYEAHRSLVRAKVLALSPAEAQRDAAKRLSHRRRYLSHVACARAALESNPPSLILMAGISGSGKTWLAQRVAPLLGAVHVRSDIERKRLAGLAASEPSHSALGQGLYLPQAREAVYEHLARCARDVLAGGFPVIVDATFQRRADRARFAELAAELGVRLWLIHCHAPEATLESRITERVRRKEDPSEADLSVMRWQSSHFEPLDATEPFAVIPASTQEQGIADRISLELRS
jgi:aminoglycoside phosphotransferase family enzyme/predicted kinase